MKFRSAKGITLVEVLIVILVLVVLGLMAIPALNRINATQQEKRVVNNLRLLNDAALRYFMRTGESRVTFSDLVGPGKEIGEITSVAGETYPQVINRDEPEIRAIGSTIPGKETITYTN
ncbi:MAG: pilus assembly protein [Opitutaceae bacterium]|jgi:type IV pilus assembly protein PilA|nr:pilus assembly protein [Opitutaceae bacterium]